MIRGVRCCCKKPLPAAGSKMKRFFAANIKPDAERVYLDPEESHYLVRVLRLQAGQQVELFDGAGSLYTAEIETLGKQVSVLLKSRRQSPKESKSSIIVCQGNLRGQKIDFLVEKCTELGVDRFIPFIAGRSQGRHDAGRQMKKQLRRRTIAKTACKQCGRLQLMQVDSELQFNDLLQMEFDDNDSLKLMLWEKEQTSTLADAIGHISWASVYLMFGPEGGFSDQEADLALSAGWLPVGLGDRILRAETATIAAVAITQHLLGRM